MFFLKSEKNVKYVFSNTDSQSKRGRLTAVLYVAIEWVFYCLFQFVVKFSTRLLSPIRH